MEKILTFSDLETQNKKKRTRREEFLGKMESIVPWPDIVSLVKPYYYSNRTGRPATRLEVILRMYFLQVWFSMSDEGLEDAIYDIKPFSTFMGVDLSGVPDATVLCNFRKIVSGGSSGDGYWFTNVGDASYWWSATESGNNAYKIIMRYNRDEIESISGGGYPDLLFVRCVQN